jgi:hypothetical protein
VLVRGSRSCYHYKWCLACGGCAGEVALPMLSMGLIELPALFMRAAANNSKASNNLYSNGFVPDRQSS